MKAFLATILVFFASSASAATLTGARIGAATNGVGGVMPGEAIVGPGVEFTVDFAFTDFFTVDISETGSIRIAMVQNEIFQNDADQKLFLSDADNVLDDFMSLVFVSATDVFDFGQDDLAVEADQLTLNLGSGLIWGIGAFVDLQLRDDLAMSEIPLGPAWAFFAFGMAGFASRLRLFASK